MIYTLTANPAIDLNVSTNKIQKNIVNRTFNTVYTPNGKGLNVSFVLKHFKVPSKVMGFFGGFSGKYIVTETEKRGINVLPVWIDEITRINVFVSDEEEGDECKFVNDGAYVNKKKQEELLFMLKDMEDLDYLTINGSLPPGISTDFYDEILEICKEKKTQVILDISSRKLKELLPYRPLLIKPNDEEIKDIFGIIMNDENDIRDVLQDLHEAGAQNVLLTMGEKGSYFFDGKTVYYASAYPVKLLSSACAGDAALAAFLSVWIFNPQQIEKALKRSAATGANVAESYALGDFKNIAEYEKGIEVKVVE